MSDLPMEFEDRQGETQPFVVQQLFTVAQAAEVLQVSRTLMYSLVEKRKIRHHRLGVGQGAIRFSQQNLQDFLDSTTVGLHREKPVEKKTKGRKQNARHLRQKRNPK